jgi:hypothetical protein
MASVLPENLDYTDKDQESLEARLFALVQSTNPDWSVADVANFGNILLSAFAFVGDVLCFYQDNQSLEARITTAQQRSSILGLVKLIGYTPAGATASRVDCVVSVVGGAPTSQILIPAETVLRTGSNTSPVTFRTLTPTIIETPGTTSVVATAENSVPAQTSVQATSVADQEVVLAATPFLDGSEVVTASNGVYTRVESFVASTTSDRHYTVGIDASDRATIRFSNGIVGQIPTGTITVSYRTGGGAIGNVGANTVTVINGSFTDDLGNSVQLAVTNPAASTPAVDRETIEEIRVSAPDSLRALTRTVTRDDYETGALEVPGVARALMLTSDEDAGIAENTGRLYIVGTDGLEATQATLDDVLTQVTVTRPNTLTFRVTVLPATRLDVTISTVVHLARNATLAQAAAEIVTNLQAYFSVAIDGVREREGKPRVDFGYYYAQASLSGEPALPISDIDAEIYDAPSVRKIDDRPDGILINGARQDLDVLLAQFPRLVQVTVIDAATSQQVSVPI